MGETCPQYLHLDAGRLDGPDGENFVCTPPLRDPWHHEELWHGLGQGHLPTVATDPCPFWMHDRRAGTPGPGSRPASGARSATWWRR